MITIESSSKNFKNPTYFSSGSEDTVKRGWIFTIEKLRK
jgi:hypothetical protein